MEQYLLPCAYKSLLGIDCPICGFQRSLLLLIKGEFFNSFKMYAPLLPVLFLIMISILYFLNNKIIKRSFLNFSSVLVLIIIAANYIIKLLL